MAVTINAMHCEDQALAILVSHRVLCKVFLQLVMYWLKMGIVGGKVKNIFVF